MDRAPKRQTNIGILGTGNISEVSRAPSWRWWVASLTRDQDHVRIA
jgi:hypothetical protein